MHLQDKGLRRSLHLQAAEAVKQKEAAREVVKRAPAKKLAGSLLKKGYQVGRPQLSVGRSLADLHVSRMLLSLYRARSTSASRTRHGRDHPG